MYNHNDQNRRFELELISSSVTMTFSQQNNGRLVGYWGQGRDRQRVLVNSIKFALCIQPGDTLEVDIMGVPMRQGGKLLVAVPTTATADALNFYPGDDKLKLSFVPKADGNGVYTIEPLTGKRVYPQDGCRVWVGRNYYYEYAVYEVDRHLIAYPVIEPQETRRDPNNPDQPYTYKQFRQQSYRRPAINQRNQRSGRQRKQESVRGTVTFETDNRGDGIIAFDSKLFGRLAIRPRYGYSFLVGAPMECDFVRQGRIVLATPVKPLVELAAESTDEVPLFTAENKSAVKRKPADNVRPKSRVDRFKERAAKAADSKRGGDKKPATPTKPTTEVHDGTLAGQLAKLLGQSNK